MVDDSACNGDNELPGNLRAKHRTPSHPIASHRIPSHPIAPNIHSSILSFQHICNSFIPLFFILTTHQLREIRPFNQYSLILICRWNIYSLGFPNRLILSPSTDLVFETILPALFTINPLLGTPPVVRYDLPFHTSSRVPRNISYAFPSM